MPRLAPVTIKVPRDWSISRSSRRSKEKALFRDTSSPAEGGGATLVAQAAGTLWSRRLAMIALFDCPVCHRTHDEPLDATYVLAVRCLDCALDEVLFERRDSERELLKAA